VSLFADRWGRKRTLIGLSLLAFAGGGLAAAADGFWTMVLGAFFGMLSGAGGDRGAAYSLEQAVLPSTAPDERRTLVYAAYGIIADVGHALGALLAGLPYILREHAGVGELASFRAAVVVHALAGLASVLLYACLSPAVEAGGGAGLRGVSPRGRRTIAKLSALFSLDSFGGGFIPSALLSYWFFRRFGVEETALGPLFAAGHFMNAVSYFAAVWLARRIGLVNTMVFTHIPSSLLLILLPFVPSFSAAACLYLLREFLVQMDVPTRQSYIVAIVRPGERTAVTGITSLVRGAARAAAPAIAGQVMGSLALSAPLGICAGLKIAYDLLLYGAFRRVKPPEER
ncbi:MAG: MFS transporter, partial [Nitrospinota bacterium]